MGWDLLQRFLKIEQSGRYQLTAVGKHRRFLWNSDDLGALAAQAAVFREIDSNKKDNYIVSIYDRHTSSKIDWKTISLDNSKGLDSSASELQKRKGRGKDNA